MDYVARLQKIRRQLDGDNVDGLLVTNLTNIRYLTGFSGTNGQLLVTTSGAHFFSDPRYAARAADLVTGAEVSIYPNRLTELLPERLRASRVQKLGVEAKTMTVFERDDLATKLEGVSLVATSDEVEKLRRQKDHEEITLIKEAVRVTDETFEWLLDRLAPGSSERELALDLEVRMRTLGADGVSFEPIVGSGPLSAHIHHTAGERTLEKGDTVLLDFGCRWQGYCSDLTRTVVLGPATDEQRAIYELVLAAQSAGMAALRAGVGGADADAAARRLIEQAGHGDAFGHGLGHGIGLEIHEAPRLHRISEDTLAAGEVVTVEPGIYVRGDAGIRIEDCVVIADDGADSLTSAPKHELLEL